MGFDGVDINLPVHTVHGAWHVQMIIIAPSQRYCAININGVDLSREQGNDASSSDILHALVGCYIPAPVLNRDKIMAP